MWVVVAVADVGVSSVRLALHWGTTADNKLRRCVLLLCALVMCVCIYTVRGCLSMTGACGRRLCRSCSSTSPW